MKKDYTTTYRLTDIEVAQALLDFVKAKEKSVPDGTWHVHASGRSSDVVLVDPTVALIIEYKDKRE